MNVGFYYHTVISSREDGLYVPGYLGVFIDALAAEVNELRVFLHESDSSDAGDYRLIAPNVRWVSLGKKTAAWHRTLFRKQFLGLIAAESGGLDVMLVRGPTPLAPYFPALPASVPVAYLVVGDYGQGAEHMQVDSLRDWAVRHFVCHNDRRFKQALRGCTVIVNSAQLHETFSAVTKDLHEVNTTTLSASDFYEREDTCSGESIRLLFTGRIVVDKGLRELVEAVQKLWAEGYPVEVDIVGWEDASTRPVETMLRELANRLGVSDRVHFPGLKKLGEELNAMYRDADVYVLPSYHEGFPRTLWEAMANGLPVVATTVGSIPAFLDAGDHALLVPPRDTDALVNAIRRVLSESPLRRHLIRHGYERARDVTLDVQSKRLVSILAEKAGRDWPDKKTATQ